MMCFSPLRSQDRPCPRPALLSARQFIKNWWKEDPIYASRLLAKRCLLLVLPRSSSTSREIAWIGDGASTKKSYTAKLRYDNNRYSETPPYEHPSCYYNSLFRGRFLRASFIRPTRVTKQIQEGLFVT